MGGDATGLRRPALADVLAALVPYKPLESSREQWWRGAKHIAFEQREGLLCVTPYGTGPWFPVVPSDTREALELLHVRGLAPEDDERRAFREVLQNQAKGALFETLTHRTRCVALRNAAKQGISQRRSPPRTLPKAPRAGLPTVV